ncbi:hypothetical protein HWV00_11565 [Moritella sp. 24]|uniref:hypothetical protein n=1 Tax=Moritella sp. 24 TaxID=2746230 RepID=UPI001BA54FAB|nr:hypothetical protein [Moritella sp. 24]QUM76822.1 hypothetical protein HWV00_11565 [Moritella sp. 24]
MSSKVNLSISTHKLAELIQAGHLCVADLNCLDAESKQQVWQLCLWSCNKRVHCTKPCTQQCNSGYCASKEGSKSTQQSALIEISAD